jgi:hypothetical protein
MKNKKPEQKNQLDTNDIIKLKRAEVEETEELLEGLIQYCQSLEVQIVILRCETNRFSYQIPNCPEPYPDVYDDLYKDFKDYSAYPRFIHLFKKHNFEIIF